MNCHECGEKVIQAIAIKVATRLLGEKEYQKFHFCGITCFRKWLTEIAKTTEVKRENP